MNTKFPRTLTGPTVVRGKAYSNNFCESEGPICIFCALVWYGLTNIVDSLPQLNRYLEMLYPSFDINTCIINKV